MIFDNLKNCKTYYGVHPKFEKAFSFIDKAFSENLEVGKYEIDGKNLYAMVQEYNSKAPEDAKFEAHKNYIDIQYIISGTERMEALDINDATPSTDYNPEKDVTFFAVTDKVTSGLFTDEGFAIFLPHDVHRPGMAAESGSEPIRKIVVKVKVD